MSSDAVTFFTFNTGMTRNQTISLMTPTPLMAVNTDAVINGLAKLLANELGASVQVSGDYVSTSFWVSPD